MQPLNLDNVRNFVNEHIVDFHRRRIKSLDDLKLERLLRKNPYLFKAKNLVTAEQLIVDLLDAFLSSSEEKLFGDFLEQLAIFIAGQTCGGQKSAATGVDLEFVNNGVEYVVSIKSGTNWGNSSQQSKLEQDLRKAVATKKQGRPTANVQAVLGICYGGTKSSFVRGYRKLVGQSFWYLISENENLYTDIVEPIGYRATAQNESFAVEKTRLTERFVKEFTEDFCDPSGVIDWKKLVEWNSGNFDPDEW